MCLWNMSTEGLSGGRPPSGPPPLLLVEPLLLVLPLLLVEPLLLVLPLLLVEPLLLVLPLLLVEPLLLLPLLALPLLDVPLLEPLPVDDPLPLPVASPPPASAAVLESSLQAASAAKAIGRQAAATRRIAGADGRWLGIAVPFASAGEARVQTGTTEVLVKGSVSRSAVKRSFLPRTCACGGAHVSRRNSRSESGLTELRRTRARSCSRRRCARARR
jgi:hypothetical protein